VPASTGVSFSWSGVVDAATYRFHALDGRRLHGPAAAGHRPRVDELLLVAPRRQAPTSGARSRSTPRGNASGPGRRRRSRPAGSTLGSIAVALGPNSPFASGELNTVPNLPVLQLRFTASAAEDVEVTSLVVSALGSADDAAQISQVKLYADVDSDGALDSLVDVPLGAPAAYAVDNGTNHLPGLLPDRPRRPVARRCC
jgi:hypothetical protein